MKIAFIVSSAELGRDGVGDYSRALAEELSGMGHEVYLVALNDRCIGAVMEEEQPSGVRSVRTLRLPESMPWEERIAIAASRLDAFQPIWVSLQFVPYGFHRKGLIFGFARRLRRLVAGRKLHVMFHELWIGTSMDSPFKDRLVGAMQRHCLIRLVRKLAPAAVHTSNPAYSAFLARDGIRAGILPLFGTVPIQADSGTEQAPALFRQQGVDLSQPARSAYWVGGIFGAIHPEWTPEPFFSELAAVAASEKKTVVIAGMGRFGSAGDRRWTEMVRTFGDRFRFALLGPLPAGTLSHVLRVLDFGISTTPWMLFGKSATGAAMTDHGIPVVVTRDDWRPRPALDVECNVSPLVRRPDAGTMKNFAGFLAGKREPFSARPALVKQLLEALAAH